MLPNRDRLLTDLLAPHRPPCVSIYLPTNGEDGGPPGTGADEHRARFDLLLEEAGRSLRRQVGAAAHADRLLAPLRASVGDPSLWIGPVAGVAAFASHDSARVVRLHRPVPPRADVAEAFCVAPLIRVRSTCDRYHVLCVGGDGAARLYEATGGVALHPVPVHGLPHRPAGPGPRAGKDLALIDWFRVLDRSVWGHHSRASGLPLMLATAPWYQALFRQVSRNPWLIGPGLEWEPPWTAPDQLLAAAWEVFEPIHRVRASAAAEGYRAAADAGSTCDELAAVYEAAANGRISYLLVDADRRIPSHPDPLPGRIAAGGLVAGCEHGSIHTDPAFAIGPRPAGPAGDLLDMIAERVLRSYGRVLVLPSEYMPSCSGAAAVLWA